jgi:hypothetical protein
MQVERKAIAKFGQINVVTIDVRLADSLLNSQVLITIMVSIHWYY